MAFPPTAKRTPVFVRARYKIAWLCRFRIKELCTPSVCSTNNARLPLAQRVPIAAHVRVGMMGVYPSTWQMGLDETPAFPRCSASPSKSVLAPRVCEGRPLADREETASLQESDILQPAITEARVGGKPSGDEIHPTWVMCITSGMF